MFQFDRAGQKLLVHKQVYTSLRLTSTSAFSFRSLHMAGLGFELVWEDAQQLEGCPTTGNRLCAMEIGIWITNSNRNNCNSTIVCGESVRHGV